MQKLVRVCSSLLKISNAYFFNINYFVTVHGKELVEEIKSETSGDLQTTLIKLVEVRTTSCFLLYFTSYGFLHRTDGAQYCILFHRESEVRRKRSTRIWLMKMPLNFLRLAIDNIGMIELYEINFLLFYDLSLSTQNNSLLMT